MNSSTTSNPPEQRPAETAPPETIKDTLISIIIAFALAFVFRGFVIEAFVIPTGSMAPTLLGQHMRFQNPDTGSDWAVGPWQATPDHSINYEPEQKNIAVNDPNSGQEAGARVKLLRSGDRILVLKYLYALFEPSRFDVIVFKNPTSPSENYIKRLIGVAGEDVALVDGDVFTRKPAAGEPAPTGDARAWERSGWTIARKPRLTQAEVWQGVFDSAHVPDPAPSGYQGPWRSDDAGWVIGGGRSFRYSPAGGGAGSSTQLIFDQTRVRTVRGGGTGGFERWEINDRYAYNQHDRRMPAFYPVSDLRMRLGIEPSGGVVEAEATVRARGHEFQGRVAGGRGVVRMRPLIGPTGIAGEWRVLGDGPAPELAPGRVTDVEFSHVDQGLRLCVGGREVASGTYDWTPAERVRFSTGRELSALMERQDPQGRNVLADPGLYVQPEARWTFTMAAGAGFRLHRVGLDRDLHYLPTTYRNTETGARIDPQGPALATNPLSTLRLGPDEFFPCGDNSPSSLDGRLMDSVDPWVAHDFDDRLGVVHRDLLLGRAFFVYWPSLIREKGPVTAPDFGRMRFIW